MGKLEGMAAICDYVNRSPSTVLEWIRSYDFPAKKTSPEDKRGGIWICTTELADEWFVMFCKGEIGRPPSLSSKKMGKRPQRSVTVR